jgi:4a-hydroxytetrahydrobiopterin dehydratase
MPRAEKLEPDEIERRLTAHPGWRLQDGKLQRTLRFPDFVQAFGFMTQVALAAERMDHHPEWQNVYGTVIIALVTHDCAGISARDFALAAFIDRLVPHVDAG